MVQRIRTSIAGAVVIAAVVGCQAWHTVPGTPGGPPPLQNPLLVPLVDREFLWSQVVDTLDDYFRIQREERVRQVGEVLLEGRIDTFPQDGSTILEPWRKDSTPGYEKLHSTLQTVRRRALVRVMPADKGFLIEVVVTKELEDLPSAERATPQSAPVQNNASLDTKSENATPRSSVVVWIPLGRDISLEQQMLTQIRARLSN